MLSLPTASRVSLQDSRRRRPPYQRVRRARHRASPSPPPCPRPCPRLCRPGRSSARQVNRKAPRPVLHLPPTHPSLAVRSAGPTASRGRCAPPGAPRLRPFSDRPLLPPAGPAARPAGRAAPCLALFCRGVRNDHVQDGRGPSSLTIPSSHCRWPTARLQASIDSFCREPDSTVARGPGPFRCTAASVHDSRAHTPLFSIPACHRARLTVLFGCAMAHLARAIMMQARPATTPAAAEEEQRRR